MLAKRLYSTLAITFLLLSVAPGQSQEPRINAVTNLASHTEGPVSPGQMVIIWGSGLGPPALVTQQPDAAGQLAAKLSGVEVLFDGISAPLLYVSGHQVAAVVPRSVALVASTEMAVVHGGETSKVFSTAVATTSVGVFTADSSGSGLVAALNSDGSYNDSAHPAKPGSWITFFVSGAGDTNPPGVDGAISDGAVPLLNPVSVRIGLREASLLYAGSAPGAVFGLVQINVVVPSDLPHGGAFPLTVTVGDSKSQDGVVVYVSGSAPPAAAAPTGLTAVSAGTDRVRLTWRSFDDLAETFHIERRKNDSRFVEVATSSYPTFLDAGLEAGEKYHYRVIAENVSGFSQYSNEVGIRAGRTGAEIPLVISQVYVNDLFGVRRYRSDFVEILNIGSTVQDLNGLSLQTTAIYSREPWTSVALSGSLLPGQHYLVGIGSQAAGANAILPAPEAAAPGQMSSFVGSVALVQRVDSLPTAYPDSEETVDLFSYATGPRLDAVLHGRPFLGPTGTTAYFRKSDGCQNTEDNAVDFYSAPPDPRNTQSPVTPCAPEALAPSITLNGVRNAATLRLGPLAPGTLAIVEGDRFSPDRTEVFVEGVQAPIYSATIDRLLIGIPVELSGRTTANLTVRTNGLESVANVVELAEASPGVFSRMSAQLDAVPPLNDGATLNGPTAPAATGSIVTVSVTGLGAPPHTLSATVGGRPAEVLELAPARSALRELHRLAVRIPNGLDGPQPLNLNVGPFSSPPVYVNLPAPAAQYDDFGAIRIDALDLAYDGFRDVLYVAGRSGDSGVITVVDPSSRSVSGSIPCGPLPDHLAVSANGRYLWLSNTHSPGEVSIQRIDLETQRVEFSTPLRELFSDQPNLQANLGVSQLRAHPADEELLVAATFTTGSTNPVIVLDGPARRLRLGPAARNIVFLSDGTFWADVHRLTVRANGIYPVRTAAEDDFRNITLAFENRVLDSRGVVRDALDLRRKGFVGYGGVFHSGDNMVYRPEDALVYFGGGFGGAQNYGIQAFDPFRMIPVSDFIFYYHQVGDLHPRGSALPGRFVSIGSEGFATVFRSNEPAEGRGGVYFFPRSVLTDRAGYPIPSAQPRTDAIRRIPIAAQGAAVDPLTGKVYLSVPSAAGSLGNTILPFDPNSGLFDQPVWVGSEPFVSRVTPDGQRLYVHLLGSRTVKRYRLPGLEFDLEFPVRTDSGRTVSASAILNVPNASSSTIAVVRTEFSLIAYARGVAVYDDGVPRPKTSSRCDGCQGLSSYYTNSAQYSESGSHLFAINNQGSGFTFTRWLFGTDGLTFEAGKPGLSAGFRARLRCAESVCVASSGVLFDPYTMERTRVFGDAAIDTNYGGFASDTLVALDTARDRAFFLSGQTLLSFELSTGNLRGTVPNVLSGARRGIDLLLLPFGDLMIVGSGEVALVPDLLLP